MAENVTITNLPDGGSTARVAYDMMKYLHNFIPEKRGQIGLQAYFDLYEQCFDLARGNTGDASKVVKS
jgi:hypothetical protein